MFSMFRRLFSDQKYQSDKAIRRLMHLPVAVFEMQLHGPGSQKLFVTECQPGMNYESFSKVTQQFLSLRNKHFKKDRN